MHSDYAQLHTVLEHCISSHPYICFVSLEVLHTTIEGAFLELDAERFDTIMREDDGIAVGTGDSEDRHAFDFETCCIFDTTWTLHDWCAQLCVLWERPTGIGSRRACQVSVAEQSRTRRACTTAVSRCTEVQHVRDGARRSLSVDEMILKSAPVRRNVTGVSDVEIDALLDTTRRFLAVNRGNNLDFNMIATTDAISNSALYNVGAKPFWWIERNIGTRKTQFRNVDPESAPQLSKAVDVVARRSTDQECECNWKQSRNEKLSDGSWRGSRGSTCSWRVWGILRHRFQSGDCEAVTELRFATSVRLLGCARRSNTSS